MQSPAGTAADPGEGRRNEVGEKGRWNERRASLNDAVYRNGGSRHQIHQIDDGRLGGCQLTRGAMLVMSGLGIRKKLPGSQAPWRLGPSASPITLEVFRG
jgi:hypothetical protein